jgi:hypothetical protein
MSMSVLPFVFASAREKLRATARAGMCVYLELACAIGLLKSIRTHVNVCSDSQGFTDEQIVMSLISLNLAGGECVDDMQILESDEGFGRVFRMAERYHLSREERRGFDGRFRKERTRHTPSPSVVFRFLSAFHDPKQEAVRQKGKAFIPKPTDPLLGLMKVNADMLQFLQLRRPTSVATFDMDATVVETCKRDALCSYKSGPSYQPHNVYWFEHDVLVYSEFRDGNVPAGHEQLRVFKEALAQLPSGVETVRLRSDTAAYQNDLLRYCATGENERFGVIEFAIGCDVTPEFRHAVEMIDEKDWQTLYSELGGIRIDTGREWAAVPLYVPNATAKSKSDPDLRYLATREVLKQQPLPHMPDTTDVAEPTRKPVTMGAADERLQYKVFGAVTNRKETGDVVLRWLYQRCGKSEEVHSIQKEDLAGGQFPSGDFGENAAWWWIMILAFNLNTIMKRLVLGDGWTRRRMKALRFNLIDVGGVLLSHAGQFIIKLSGTAEVIDKLQDMRRAIYALKFPAPT